MSTTSTSIGDFYLTLGKERLVARFADAFGNLHYFDRSDMTRNGGCAPSNIIGQRTYRVVIRTHNSIAGKIVDESLPVTVFSETSPENIEFWSAYRISIRPKIATRN